MSHGFHSYVSHNQRATIKLSGWWLPNYLENMKVNGKDYPIYEMENKSHVPNHQPDILTLAINHQSMDWFNTHILGNQTVFF